MLMTSQCNNCIQENATKEMLAALVQMFMGRKIFACIFQKTFKLSQKIRIARENPTCRRLEASEWGDAITITVNYLGDHSP